MLAEKQIRRIARIRQICLPYAHRVGTVSKSNLSSFTEDDASEEGMKREIKLVFILMQMKPEFVWETKKLGQRCESSLDFS